MSRIHLVVVAVLVGAGSVPGQGAVISVNSVSDARANDGACSLREATIAANSNAPSGPAAGECASGNSGVTDTIVLPAGTYNLTLAGADNTSLGGDLDVTQNLVIQGAGSGTTVVNAAAIGERALHINAGVAQVNISGVRIANGFSTGHGGGVYSSAAALTLADVVLAANHADFDGGGLVSGGTVSISASSVIGNTADGEGGGIAWGGSQLSIVDSVIAGNRAQGGFGDGGGIDASFGVLSLVNSSVVGNHADDLGGGLHIEGDLAASGSTISGNDADGDGGGIYFDFPNSSELDNCTISGNDALGYGGGIAILSNDNVTLTHCTVADNNASQGTAIGNGEFIVVANSILAGTCAVELVTSLGGNIESPGDNCGLTDLTDDISVSTVALGLEPLSSNGGRTLTHLPSPTSAALNQGKGTLCLAGDQRGVGRPLGGGCDAGAVERHPGHVFIDGLETADKSHWSGSTP